MFERLKSGLKGLVNKVTTTELKAENLRPVLSDFKLTLVENDVAFPVAERVCDEMEKRLDGVQVKRLEDRKRIVEENLREVLLETMLTNNKINFFDAIEEKRKKNEPFIIVFLGINGTGKTTTIAKVARLLNKKGYSVVLACSDTYRAGSIEQLEEHAKRLGIRMIKHKYGADPAAVAYDAISHAKAHGINVVLIDTAGRMQTNNKIDFLKAIQEKRKKGEPYVIVFVGINGTGKTTTIAKVCRFLNKKGYSAVIACSDTYRAGSIEQLEEHAKRLGTKMIKHAYGADPAAVAYDTISHAKAHGISVVLIDTAGRMQTNQNLMNELAKIKRVVNPDLTILTVDSLIGNDAVI